MALFDCPYCGTTTTDASPDWYLAQSSGRCPRCGKSAFASPTSIAVRDSPAEPIITIPLRPPANLAPIRMAEPIHYCPWCGSGSVAMVDEKQGFGFGKALAGGLLLGPWGLFAGAINRNKRSTLIRCNACFRHSDSSAVLRLERRGLRTFDEDRWRYFPLALAIGIVLAALAVGSIASNKANTPEPTQDYSSAPLPVPEAPSSPSRRHHRHR